MTDPTKCRSYESTDAPFYTVFGANIFDWYSHPTNELPLKRFGAAMKGAINIHNFDITHSESLACSVEVLDRDEWSCFVAFNWASLPQDSVVVDVGGGIGSSSLVLAKAQPHLKIVVQDINATIADGVKVSTSPQIVHPEISQ